jgi:hypothetical protein
MGMALAAKRGKGHFNGKIQEVADSMSEKQLHDFAVTKHKDIPEKKAEILSLMRAKLASEGLLVSSVSNGEITDTIKSFAKNFYKRANEKLVGGMGDNKPDSLFPKKELFKGIKHESEHTNNKSIAKEIAKDHLSEQTDYYTALNKAKLGYSKI